VSPTAPTFVTLSAQLTKAHRRIRELEAREAELAARNKTLRAAITELAHDDHPGKTAATTATNRTKTSRFPYV
jgi:cell division protein FtsB